MALGGRSPSTLLAGALRWRNYRGLIEAFRRYASPLSDLRRYVAGTGTYPYRCRIRTRGGLVCPTLYSHHDMLTVHEVFCRRVYPVDPASAVIVDVGANIGISALYFLTEAPHSRCHLFEANPALIGRLRGNLGELSPRVVVNELALATFDGRAEFGLEKTGRYGGIGVPAPATIEVPCRSATGALEQVLAAEGEIDLLKLDVEGIELDLLRSLPGSVLDRIHAIHVETESPHNPLPGSFEMKRTGLVSSLFKPTGGGSR
jgi:FkbM family methyltransferase